MLGYYRIEITEAVRSQLFNTVGRATSVRRPVCKVVRCPSVAVVLYFISFHLGGILRVECQDFSPIPLTLAHR